MDRKARDKVGSIVRYKSYGRLDKLAGDGDGDEMLVRGFFTSDEVDEVGDIITREATDKAVKKWRKWGNIRTMHDYPSGKVVSIGEADGLDWNEIVTTPVDEGTAKLIDGGVLQAYSVGIIPREYEINEDLINEEDDPWFWPLIIHDYDMIEISYVDHPANYSATISDVAKSAGSHDDVRAVIYKSLPEIETEGDVPNKEPKPDTGEEIPASEDLELEEKVAADESVEDVDGDGDSGSEDVEVSNDEPVSKDADDADAEEQEDKELDIALVVRDLESRIEELEDRLVGELQNELVELVMGRVMLELGADKPEVPEAEDVDGDLDAEELEASTEMDLGITAETISDLVVEKITALLQVGQVQGRTALITLDVPSEDDDEDTPDAAESLMNMSRDERRLKMRSIVEKHYGEGE